MMGQLCCKIRTSHKIIVKISFGYNFVRLFGILKIYFGSNLEVSNIVIYTTTSL